MWPYDEQEANWLKTRSDYEIVAAARRIRVDALRDLARLGWRKAQTALGPLVAAFAAWQERQRASEQLYGMTDRELSDIGLTRFDIPAVLEGSFREETGARTRRRAFTVRINPGRHRSHAGDHKLAA